MNQRYLSGALKTGCHAILECLRSSGAAVEGVDLLAVCTCTGYVCPDVGSRLIGHLGFRKNVQRASIVGLGCAGAIPTLQRATDFVRANPGRQALMLAVEICSACYYVDHTLETVVGNAICADGAAAFLLGGESENKSSYPQVVDFETFLDTNNIEEVGLQQRDGRLRIVREVRFSTLRVGWSKEPCKNFCRAMASAIPIFGSGWFIPAGARQVVRTGDPQPKEWGVMIALGPGMAAEAVLLRW